MGKLFFISLTVLQGALPGCDGLLLFLNESFLCCPRILYRNPSAGLHAPEMPSIITMPEVIRPPAGKSDMLSDL